MDVNNYEDNIQVEEDVDGDKEYISYVILLFVIISILIFVVIVVFKRNEDEKEKE